MQDLPGIVPVYLDSNLDNERQRRKPGKNETRVLPLYQMGHIDQLSSLATLLLNWSSIEIMQWLYLLGLSHLWDVYRNSQLPHELLPMNEPCTCTVLDTFRRNSLGFLDKPGK